MLLEPIPHFLTPTAAIFSLSLGEINPLPPRTCLGTINRGGMINDFFKNPLLELSFFTHNSIIYFKFS